MERARAAPLRELVAEAEALRRTHRGGRTALCAIVNVKSGRCGEDCRFCAQSAHWDTGATEHGFIAPDAVRAAARRARDKGVKRLGLVASGRGLAGADFDRLLTAIDAVHDEGLRCCVSPGMLDPQQIEALREAGAHRVHHNLETGAAFFPTVCSTHSYSQRRRMVEQALEAGLKVCCGGVFGLGETWEDRAALAADLRALGVDSVPLNFFLPIPGTPLAHRATPGPEEALRIISLFRLALPRATLRLCAGRAEVFAQAPERALACGADGMMVGDFLTRPGADLDADLRRLADAGLALE